MAKLCPETNSYVLYLDCLECDTKTCINNKDNNDDKKETILNKNTLPNRNNVL